MINIELGRTGEKIPILGQGTWGIKKFHNKEELTKIKATIERGIEIGMTHIDTAELYGGGKAEEVVGEVIANNRRDDLFITSKLFPMHLGEKAMKKACDKSLRRLGIDCLDLYLVHFPSFFGPKIKKHMKVMEELLKEGKTRYIGVSNYSVKQFKEAQSYLKNTQLVTNQLVCNISKQKHIIKSLPYYQKEGVTLTAYSPSSHSGFTNLKGILREKLEKTADANSATIQQIAIAWLINHDNVITIPRAFQLDHLHSNSEAVNIKLSQEEMKLLQNFNVKILNSIKK